MDTTGGGTPTATPAAAAAHAAPITAAAVEPDAAPSPYVDAALYAGYVHARPVVCPSSALGPTVGWRPLRCHRHGTTTAGADAANRRQRHQCRHTDRTTRICTTI